MPKLVTALLCKNEADRYLRKVLERCLSFSDSVLVLDDASTDGTAALARSLGCKVRKRGQKEAAAWGTETPARAELWDWAASEAGDGWVLFCDADMILHGDPRPLCWSTEASAWAFILFDLWNPEGTLYRADGFWQGHLTPRPWLVRPKGAGSDYRPSWGQRGIHSGHIPPNFPLRIAVAPLDSHYWLHFAYAKPEDRLAKCDKYMQIESQLTPFERAHALSIKDE